MVNQGMEKSIKEMVTAFIPIMNFAQEPKFSEEIMKQYKVLMELKKF